MKITHKQLWDALDSGHTYESLSPNETARFEKAYDEFQLMFTGESRRRTLCYVEHKSCHLPYVIIDPEAQTYEFHDNSFAHAFDPMSHENSLEMLENIRTLNYTQVLP